MPTHQAPATAPSPGLPLVVQIAFSGSRMLLDPDRHPRVDPDAFLRTVQTRLAERLGRLPAELHLTRRHLLCGFSSLAAGADTLFARACAQLGWSLRIFLPQPREDFLAAEGSTGPDFTPAAAAAARELFASPHVIEERVASTSADRQARFEDVNLELVRVSDVVVCLVAADRPPGKPGGTADVLALAARHHRPTLEIQVGVGAEGAPALTEVWHWNPPPDAPPERRAGFLPPQLPPPLDQIECVDCGRAEPAQYRETLKNFASDKAREKRWFFVRAALVIVGTHVLATTLALRAVQNHNSPMAPWLLAVELAMVAAGLLYHEWLHRSHAAREWALARLTAEAARSVIHLAGVPRPLRHLFELPMPDNLRPLLRTLDLFHLANLRKLSPADWKARRDSYVTERLAKPGDGQLDYYRRKTVQAGSWLRDARVTFYVGSAGALVATACKLAVLLHEAEHHAATELLGFFAVLLPVVAVAALSLAAAFDLEARVHTYKDMLAFLQEQTLLLQSAATENEFAALAWETEAHLLGETANWYARRAFTGVA